MHHDSLREIVVGMLSEAHKLQHLGIDYMARRSILSEANNRRNSDFFAQIYFSLYKQYKKVLPDSNNKKHTAKLYAEQVLSGDILTCEFTQLAAKRYHTDFEMTLEKDGTLTANPPYERLSLLNQAY